MYVVCCMLFFYVVLGRVTRVTRVMEKEGAYMYGVSHALNEIQSFKAGVDHSEDLASVNFSLDIISALMPFISNHFFNLLSSTFNLK